MIDDVSAVRDPQVATAAGVTDVGIGYHEMMFLKETARAAPLGDVLTLGRQNLNVSPAALAAEKAAPSDTRFGDALLVEHFGATSVSSVDASDYEGATYVGDLNRPLDLGRRFDTVVDFGTSEHVFDIAAAFRNAIAHCKPGGRIVHALPSNSDNGHGFYQLSPELFFSLYSDRNGFTNTAVFLADLMNEKSWWQATPPKGGQRLLANALSTTYAMCRTEKVADVENLQVQQSDYQHAWEQGEAQLGKRSALERARNVLKGTFAAQIATMGYRTWLAKTGLTRFNPNLRKVRIVKG